MRLYMASVLSSRDAYPAIHRLGYPYLLLTPDELRANPMGEDFKTGEWLLDSGLYSYIAGSRAFTAGETEVREYCGRYLELVDRVGWKHPIVECDAQTVLGVEPTWRLRQDFFEKCGREVMYVWHLPDERAGLERMAERYGYIGFGLPELKRKLGTLSEVRRLLIWAVGILRKKNPRVKVHLLGYSDPALVGPNPWSSDSTTWSIATRFGAGCIYNAGAFPKQISIRSPKWSEWERALRDRPEFEAAFSEAKSPGAELLLSSVIAFHMYQEAQSDAVIPRGG